MRKLFITICFTIISIAKMFSCGGDYYDEYSYYSLLFSQELINAPRYYPFLLAPEVTFYQADSAKVKNANIEEWQKHLNISYDQAHYLVFKAKEDDVRKLAAGKTVNDNRLAFANTNFVKKYTDALQYILVAKELEPYMRISGGNSGWYYYDETGKDVEGIPYDETSLKLQKAWKLVTNKELKLRYGYQLVRLAHYNRDYDGAIHLFDTYVEPLNYKSEMYYYALSQKAGAIRGTGDVITANSLFFEVFSHSVDLKSSAFLSIRLNENADYERFLSIAKTDDEKNDADLLLGYISFSNPLASARKIVKRSPDAIQAKVLAARAISSIESDIKNYGDIAGYSDKYFPIIENNARKNFNEVLAFVKQQANAVDVKQKNYWNIASAYLSYLAKNYTDADSYLSKIDIKEEGYREQKDILAMLVDVGRRPTIDADAERHIFSEYKDIFVNRNNDGRSRTASFVIDVLSNRYYLQKDYAKSFMLENNLAILQDNPNMTLLVAIEEFYDKPDKNPFEKYLIDTFIVGSLGYGDMLKATVPDYLNYMKGVVFLTNNNLDEAREMFDKTKYSRDNVSSDLFGYNRIECYTCYDNMKTDYLSEFSYIDNPMSEKELTDVLLKLKKDAEGSGLKAAKANYLLGNFYYNTSVIGYFRNYLRFGYEGGYRQSFFCPSEKNYILKNQIYLKHISTYYDNTVDIADSYLKKAYSLSSGDEFKARIVFALSKCELEKYYQNITNKYCGEDRWQSYKEDWAMISDRRYFAEMMKYKNTSFFEEVQSNCQYFDYYVNHL